MPALRDFAGRWQLTRCILDRRAGAEGRFEGTATLTPGGAGLAYAETGLLTLGTAPPMTAERRYFWAEAPGGLIAVRFADGRPFHGFDPATGTPAASHWCDPDDYRVAYDLTRWPEWQATWDVTGPRKDYRMESFYRR
ncbi:DUF6314 family protein [Solirhodobacter olei]|uniref:DUF6314 family protein n=1 Tax=Solirhodobacter olei TaxID=2493082 RepID=UPI000FDA8424|nr:DUF6314 family protein [Solirhodobacter olei]